MLWEDVAQLLSPIAPTLGQMLGNSLPIPFGGTVGRVVGQAIADALGVPATPAAVGAAIQATPTDVLKAQLADAEEDARAKYQAIAEGSKAEARVGVAQVGAVAGTVQAELINGTWLQRSWRPLAMLVWVAMWPVQVGSILYPIWFHDAASISSLPSLIYALSAWNAAPAALAGIYSWNRTQEKVAATDAASKTT